MYKLIVRIITILYRPIVYLKTFRLWYKKVYHHHDKSGATVKIPFFTKLKYNCLGFTDIQYVIYHLGDNNYKEYISTWERLRLEDVNGRFAYFLGEKVMFERMFGQFVNVPHIHCWVKCGKFINLDNNNAEISIIDEIQKEVSFIAKPTRSLGGGKMIHELSYVDKKYFFDGKELNEIDFIHQCRKLEEYIITKKISSHNYSKRIYPYSSNTIRVITVMDNHKNEADVLLAFHRFGTKMSRFVDNMSSGGIVALVDLETGVLGHAKPVFDFNNLDKCYSFHPDTGAPIEGVHVPNWALIINKLKHVHKCYAYYKFFAWDVTLDKDGKVWILEINRGSDLEVQVVSPLKQSLLGIWMKKNGLLKTIN